MRLKKAHRRSYPACDMRAMRKSKQWLRKYYPNYPLMTNEQIRDGLMPEEVFGWDYERKQMEATMHSIRQRNDCPPAMRQLMSIYDLVMR